MEKKLTSQGPKNRNSYTLTVPKEWVKEQGVDKQRTVELEKVGNKLIISPRKQVAERVIIDTKDYGTLIKVLPGLYRLGVDEIKIMIHDNRMLEQITGIINELLIGYEIMEQKQDFVLVKDITKESEEDFKTILRRIFLLLIELSNSEGEIRIDSLDNNVGKLINYCQRIIMKKGHADYVKTPVYYLLLDQMEKIGDEFGWLLKSDKKPIAELNEIRKLLRNAYELFYKFKAKKFTERLEESYELKNKFRKGEEIEATVMHIHNLSRLLNSMYGTLFMLKFKE